MDLDKSDPSTENIVNGGKESLEDSSKDQLAIENSASDVKPPERDVREDLVINLSLKIR